MRDDSLTPLEEVLRRVDIDRPVLSYAERRELSDADWASLLEAGLVRQIENAEWVDCDCGDGEDVYFATHATPPYPYVHCREYGILRVEPERLQQWTIDLVELAAALSAALSCAGRVEELVPGRLWLLGRTALGARTREVFLARRLAWSDAAGLLGSCARFQAAVAPVVLVAGVVPRQDVWNGRVPPVLTLPAFVTLEGGHLLTDRAYLESAITPRAPTETAVERAESAYCRAILRGDRRDLTKREYETRVRKREDFGLFIDGHTGEALCRERRGKVRAERLTTKELAILADVVTAGKALRPAETPTGRTCNSPDAARRLFEGARKKVDVRLSRYEFRAFRLVRSRAGPEHHAYEFAPPSDLDYCVILPA